MTLRTPTTYRIEDDLLQGLRFVKERDGIPVSEQVRRAVRAWLESRGVEMKTAPPTYGHTSGSLTPSTA